MHRLRRPLLASVTALLALSAATACKTDDAAKVLDTSASTALPDSPGADRPQQIAPGVLYMVSDLAAEHSGKILGVSSRGVREIKMLETEGFAPGRPYTAQEVAENASKVFFKEPENVHRLSSPVAA